MFQNLFFENLLWRLKKHFIQIRGTIATRIHQAAPIDHFPLIVNYCSGDDLRALTKTTVLVNKLTQSMYVQYNRCAAQNKFFNGRIVATLRSIVTTKVLEPKSI